MTIRPTQNAANPRKRGAPTLGPLALRWLSWTWALSLWALLVYPGCQPRSQAPTHTTNTRAQAIIGGTTDLTQPAIGALVHRRGNPFCTGTLITQQLVLTAAHCIASARQRGAQEVQLRIDFPEPQNTYRSEFYNIQAMHTHPQYNGGSNGHETDLGVLILTQKVTTATPLPILQSAMDPTWLGKTVQVVGYGLISTRPVNKRADAKYAADIPIYQIDTRSFIHYDQQGNKSACHGDSGGPALFQIGGKPHIIGITSVAYKATPAPQAGLTYCDGGAISTRPDAHITSFLQQYLTLYADAPKACTDDTPCAPCGTCQQQRCAPLPIKTEATTCKPCHKDQDCGLGRCHRFPNGYRCLQPCAGPKGQCCPSGQYCSSTFTGNAQALCIPAQHACPEVSCQAATDCGRGETCKDGACIPDLPALPPEQCRPCYTSQECGPNGFCHDSLSSFGYCIQPCTIGQFCHPGYSCQDVAPGLSMCIPSKACLMACGPNQPCPTGYSCQNSQCLPKNGGTQGDFCHDKLACQTNYQCMPVDPNQPMRCARLCGPPIGAPGSACTNGACGPGLQCIQIDATTKACLETCQGSCVKGGQCYQLGAALSVCLCQDDSDCENRQHCNTSALGAFGVGACADNNIGPSPCLPGTSCQSNPPAGQACLPKQGERGIGQTCSLLLRCTKGLSCQKLTNLTQARCYETCSATKKCQNANVCIQGQDGEGYCLCTQSSSCPTGTICHPIGSTPTHGTVGFCERTDAFVCRSLLDCPAEHSCKDGKCLFDSSRQNEPFPEPTPAEPTPEARLEATPVEPAPEPQPEASTDEASQDATHEPAPGDTTPDARETTPQDKRPTPSTDNPSTIETPPETPTPTPHCGCQTTPNAPTSIIFVLFVLLALTPWQWRRSRT